MSEEEKTIKRLKEITNNYSLNSEDLHYAIVLYHLIINLQQENQQLKEDYNKVVHEATEFESRVYELEDKINKAIEYIEKCNPDADLHSMFLSESYISNYGACELLEILKGDKDE